MLWSCSLKNYRVDILRKLSKNTTLFIFFLPELQIFPSIRVDRELDILFGSSRV